MINLPLSKIIRRAICLSLSLVILFYFSGLYLSTYSQDYDDDQEEEDFNVTQEDESEKLDNEKGFNLDSQEPTLLKGYVSKIPVGTKISIILETPADELTSMIGDEVVARTSEDIVVDGKVVIPAGSTVIGNISEINYAKRLHRSGNVRIEFKNLALSDGRQAPIVASVLSRSGLIKGKYTKKRALIAGATVIGPSLAGFGAGLAAEGSAVGATVGAVIGALGGIGLFLFQKGNMVDIHAGDEMEIELTEETILPIVDESDITKSDTEGSDEMKPTSTEPDTSKTNVTEIDFTETDSTNQESDGIKQKDRDSNDLELIEVDEDLELYGKSKKNNLQTED